MIPFTFDFTGVKPTMQYTEQEVTPTQKVINVRCPYKVPTVDEIMKKIEKAAQRIDTYTFIDDILECGALAIANLVDLPQKDAREEQYKKVISKYQKNEQDLMAEIFGDIFALLSSVTYDDGVFGDYLGELFMRCNMGNKHCGQFFTPYHVSELMAQMTVAENKEKVLNDEIITICDPCCGSAGMMMAMLDVLKNKYNINYAYNCFIECADVDVRCVHMAYLQLSLAGVPAIVYHRNSLTMETWSVWKTPAFIFQYMRFCKYENYTQRR